MGPVQEVAELEFANNQSRSNSSSRMKAVILRRLFPIPALLIAFAIITFSAHAESQTGQVLILAVSGDVTTALRGETWKPVKAGEYLPRGASIKTGPTATADLALEYNGTVLRMQPGTTLEFAKLDKEQGTERAITETRLKLVAGSVVGSQRKLPATARLVVELPDGTATIIGTEYLVRADGAVTVLSGAVSVNYNLPGNQGSVKVVVQAGFSFDPATGQVVPTSPDFLVDIIADIDTVRQNAMTFKAGGATVVVKPEEPMSPTGANRAPAVPGELVPSRSSVPTK